MSHFDQTYRRVYNLMMNKISIVPQEASNSWATNQTPKSRSVGPPQPNPNKEEANYRVTLDIDESATPNQESEDLTSSAEAKRVHGLNYAPGRTPPAKCAISGSNLSAFGDQACRWPKMFIV